MAKIPFTRTMAVAIAAGTALTVVPVTQPQAQAVSVDTIARDTKNAIDGASRAVNDATKRVNELQDVARQLGDVKDKAGKVVASLGALTAGSSALSDAGLDDLSSTGSSGFTGGSSGGLFRGLFDWFTGGSSNVNTSSSSSKPAPKQELDNDVATLESVINDLAAGKKVDDARLTQAREALLRTEDKVPMIKATSEALKDVLDSAIAANKAVADKASNSGGSSSENILEQVFQDEIIQDWATLVNALDKIVSDTKMSEAQLVEAFKAFERLHKTGTVSDSDVSEYGVILAIGASSNTVSHLFEEGELTGKVPSDIVKDGYTFLDKLEKEKTLSTPFVKTVKDALDELELDSPKTSAPEGSSGSSGSSSAGSSGSSRNPGSSSKPAPSTSKPAPKPKPAETTQNPGPGTEILPAETAKAMLERDKAPAKQVASKISTIDADYAKARKAFDAVKDDVAELNTAMLRGGIDKAKYDAGISQAKKSLAAVKETVRQYQKNSDALVKEADKALSKAGLTREFVKANTPKDADLNYRSAIAVQEASDSYDTARRHVKQAEGLSNQVNALEHELSNLKYAPKTSSQQATPAGPSTAALAPSTTAPKPSVTNTTKPVDAVIKDKNAEDKKVRAKLERENAKRDKEANDRLAERDKASKDFADQFNEFVIHPSVYLESPKDKLTPGITTTYLGDKFASADSNYALGKNTPSWVKLVDPKTAKLEITPPRAAEGKSFDVEVLLPEYGDSYTVTFDIATREEAFRNSYNAGLGYDTFYPSGMGSFRTGDVERGTTKEFALRSGTDMIVADPKLYKGQLSYKLDKAPKWVKIDEKTGKLTASPGNNVAPGTYEVTTKIDLGDGVVLEGRSKDINVVVNADSFANNGLEKPKLAADPYAKENRADSYKQSVQFDKSYFPPLPVGLSDAPRNVVNIGESKSFPLVTNRDWTTKDDFVYTGQISYHIRDNMSGWVEIDERTGELTVNPPKGMFPGEYTVQTYVDLGDGVIVYRPDTTIRVTDKAVDQSRPSKDASTSEILSYLKRRANR